jgi:hypothetical protein
VYISFQSRLSVTGGIEIDRDYRQNLGKAISRRMLVNKENKVHLPSIETVSSEDDPTLRRTVVVVENASIAAVNGEYHFSGFKTMLVCSLESRLS